MYRIIQKIKITVLLLIIFSTNAYTQLNWIHPKPSGATYWWCKMWNTTTWYAVGYYGIFIKTTDGGNSWFVNNKTGGPGSVGSKYGDLRDAHFFDMNTGIVVGQYGTVAKTSNGGFTFDTIPGTYNGGYWYGIYFLNNSTGYIAGQNGRLMKTTDAGGTWEFNNSIPGGSNRYYDIYTPDDNLILVSSSSGNIQRSADGGSSWTQINTGGSGTLYCMEFINNDTGFVTGSSNAVRLTTNGGLNWTSKDPPISDTWYDIDIISSGGNPDVYLCGSDYFIYQSTNMGDSWDTIGITAPTQTYFAAHLSLSIEGDKFLSVGSGGIINFKSGMSTPQQLTKNVRLGTQIDNYDVWAENGSGKVWAVGEPQSPGNTFDQILYSSNGGETWTYQSTVNSSAEFYSICMLDVNSGYIAGMDGEVMKTTNGGVNWLPLITPTSNNLRCVDFVNENTGWIFGVSGTLYKTTNGGGSWVPQTCTSTGNNRGSICMLDENTGWIAGGTGAQERICKTTNGGINWIDQNVSVLADELMDIKMIDANTGYASGAGVIRKTTDGGLNWNVLAHPLPPGVQFLGLDFISSQVGIVISFGALLHTSDGGQSWNIQYGYAGSNYPRLHMISADTFFVAGKYCGVFKSNDALVNTITWENIVPDEYKLLQNYPNPFNPGTTIEFSIPEQGKVTLKIFDIAGREVATLINGLELNPGTIKQTFDGSNLASGVYFYSLTVDNNLVDTKKMVLIK